MRGAVTVPLLACLLAFGCDDAREARCSFGVETALFRGQSLALDDVALAGSPRNKLALFSDESGLHSLRLDASGVAHGAPRRVDRRCAGGLAATRDGTSDAVLVVCLRPAATRADAAARAATLYRVDAAQRATALASFGTAGALSHGVALVQRGSSVWVAFQDAIVGEARSWLVALQLTAAGASVTSQRVLSSPDLRGGAPSLAVHEGRVLASWAETQDDGIGRVLFADLGRATPPRVLFATRDPVPSPTLLAVDADAAPLVLAFRDLRERRRKAGLFVTALDAEGAIVRRARRVARADGTGRPALRVCGTASARSIIAATPRTFGGDYFVGAVSIDTALERVSGEQQFYEDSREYSQVAVDCAPEAALLLIAERGKPDRGRAVLRSVPLACR